MQTRHKMGKATKKTPPKPQPVPGEVVPPKRGPGRPRKYPRPEDQAAPTQTTEIPQHREVIPEPVNEEFTMDYKATFDVTYPPESEPTFDAEFPVSKWGRTVFEFEKPIIMEIVTRWWRGEGVIVCDESDYAKLPMTVIAMKMLKEKMDAPFPILVLTTANMLLKWVSEFNDWTDFKIAIFGNSKVERKLVGNESLFFVPDSPKNFDVMLISREQFVRDSSSLPNLVWHMMIVDDLTPSKALYHQSLIGLSDIKRLQMMFIFQNPSNLNPTDVQTVNGIFHIDDPAPLTVAVSLEEICAAEFLEEKVYFCPMTAQQIKQCQQQFTNCRDQLIQYNGETKYNQRLCQIVKQLRRLATHPALKDGGNETNDNPEPVSGKFKELMKILAVQQAANRRVAIVCADLKTVMLVNAALKIRKQQFESDRIIRLDGSTRPKQLEKFAKQFNTSDGFCILLLPIANEKPIFTTVLPMISADTIISMDLDLLAMTEFEEIVKWYRRSQLHPEIIRLMSLNSIEQLMFEDYWMNRSLSVLDFEDADKAESETLITILKRTAALVFGENKEGESSCVIRYEVHEPLVTREFEFGENFWETIMPKAVKAVKPKQLSPQQFWSEEQAEMLYEWLMDYGWNRWDRFEAFGRTKKELEKVSLIFVKHFLTEPKQYPRLRDATGIDSKEGVKIDKKFIASLPAVTEKLTQINGKMFLKTLESLIVLTSLKPRSVQDINLDASAIQPLNETWTIDDDKELLLRVYDYGLTKVPLEFHPELSSRDELCERALFLISKIILHKPKTNIIKLRPTNKEKISLADHQKIINELMAFGFPGIELFHDRIDTALLPGEVEKYVEIIFQYCDASNEDKKSLVVRLAEKLPKYTSVKIPQRRELFERIRSIQRGYQRPKSFAEYSAEDLEFLTAISYHGMGTTSMSPILNVACMGSCSEAKLYMRVKALMSQPLMTEIEPVTQDLPDDILARFPLKMNDMMMLLNIGEIDRREGFHNDTYIYPIGYRACCICQSPAGRDPLIWIECSVTEKNGMPWFTVKPYKGETWKFAGPTPDQPFADLRAKLAKKTHKFIPPIDGHEMFGFTTSLFHRIIVEMPGFEYCEQYIKRSFRTPITLTSDWPIIGKFEGLGEKVVHPGPGRPPKDPAKKLEKMLMLKKKMAPPPPEPAPPLRFDFSKLFEKPEPEPEEPFAIRVQTSAWAQIPSMMSRYERWDAEEMDKYMPKKNNPM